MAGSADFDRWMQTVDVLRKDSEKHGEELGACSFFRCMVLDCFGFAGTALVSWVTGGEGKTDGLLSGWLKSQHIR